MYASDTGHLGFWGHFWQQQQQNRKPNIAFINTWQEGEPANTLWLDFISLYTTQYIEIMRRSKCSYLNIFLSLKNVDVFIHGHNKYYIYYINDKNRHNIIVGLTLILTNE